MKTKLAIICCFLLVNTYAQIGINYTPTGTETAPLIIKKSTTVPALRLETNQTISKDQVVFSDNYGNISWRTYGLINVPAVSGTYGAGVSSDLDSNSFSGNITNVIYSNAYIDLPPGKWAVNLNFNLDIKTIKKSSNTWTESNLTPSQFVWARIVLSDNTNTNVGYNANSTTDRVISNLYLSSGMLQGPSGSNIIKGEIYIHNKGLVNKKYYVKISLECNTDKYTLNNDNKIRLKSFAKGPSFETNAVDRFFAVYAGE